MKEMTKGITLTEEPALNLARVLANRYRIGNDTARYGSFQRISETTTNSGS